MGKRKTRSNAGEEDALPAKQSANVGGTKVQTCASVNRKRNFSYTRPFLLAHYKIPGMTEKSRILGLTHKEFETQFPGGDNSAKAQQALLEHVLGPDFDYDLALTGEAKAEELVARMFNWELRAHHHQEVSVETIVNFDNPALGIISQQAHGKQWRVDQKVMNENFTAERVQEIWAVEYIDLDSMPVGAAVAEKKAGDQELMEENQKMMTMMAKHEEMAKRELLKERMDQQERNQELALLREQNGKLSRENAELKDTVWDMKHQLKEVQDRLAQLQRAAPFQMRMDSPSYSEEVLLNRSMADRTNPATLLPPLARQSSGLSSNSSEGFSADTGFTDGGFASCAAAVHHQAVEPAPPPMADALEIMEITAVMDDAHFQN